MRYAFEGRGVNCKKTGVEYCIMKCSGSDTSSQKVGFKRASKLGRKGGNGILPILEGTTLKGTVQKFDFFFNTLCIFIQTLDWKSCA